MSSRLSLPDWYIDRSNGMSCWGLPPPKMVPCNLFCSNANSDRFNVASVSDAAHRGNDARTAFGCDGDILIEVRAVGPTDGDDDLASHSAGSDFCDRHQCGVDVGISVCGTEFECLIALPFDRVDGKDPMRTTVHCAEHRCCTYAAYADDDNIVTGSNLSRSRRRSESRCHTAADERRNLKRYRGVDLHQ